MRIHFRKTIIYIPEKFKEIHLSILLTLLGLSFTTFSLLIHNNSAIMEGIGDNFTIPFEQIFSPKKFYQSNINLPIQQKKEYQSKKFNYIFFLDASGSTNDDALINSLKTERNFEEEEAKQIINKVKKTVIQSINSINSALPNTEYLRIYNLKELLLIHQLYMLHKIQQKNDVKIKFKVIQFGSSKANKVLSREKSWSQVNYNEINNTMIALKKDSQFYHKTDISKFLHDLDFVLKNTYNNENETQNIITVISDFADTETAYTSLMYPQLKRISQYFTGDIPLNLSLIKLPSQSSPTSSMVLKSFSSFIPNEYMNIHFFPLSIENETIHLTLKSNLSPIFKHNKTSIDFYYSDPTPIQSSTILNVIDGLAKKDPKILVSLHEHGNTSQRLNYKVIDSKNEASKNLNDKGFIHQNYPNAIPLKSYEGLNLTYYFNNNTLPRLTLEVYLEDNLYRYLIPIHFKRRLDTMQAYLIVGSEILSILFFLLLTLKFGGTVYLKMQAYNEKNHKK